MTADCKNKLLAKFNVYPDGRWFFFQVFVWEKRSEMHKALRRACIKSWRCEAICCCNRLIKVEKGKPARKTGLLGQIHFYRESFSMGVITHESGHAALFWAREKGINPNAPGDEINVSTQEESFCYALGNIARQIVLKTDRQWKFPASSERKVNQY